MQTIIYKYPVIHETSEFARVLQLTQGYTFHIILKPLRGYKSCKVYPFWHCSEMPR